MVFAEVANQCALDLERVARDMDEAGGYDSGLRVQSTQADVDERLGWLLEALAEERDRRQEEQQQPQQQAKHLSRVQFLLRNSSAEICRNISK